MSGPYRGSVQGSQAGSRAGSPPRPSRQNVNPSGSQATKKDEKDPMRPVDRVGKRVDLPADAFLTATRKTRFTARPGFNTKGRDILVALNIFPIETFQDNNIYQYAVSIMPTQTKTSALRAVMRKLWNSDPVQKFLTQNGGKWLCDFGLLAWSSQAIPDEEFEIEVDLDENQANKTKVGRANKFILKIKQSNIIRLHYLRSYVEGKIGWDTHVLECMNFFDHCMRQSASENMVSIQRKFYPKTGKPVNLGAVIEVHKGYYAAARLGQAGKLMINIDTANTAFWQALTISNTALGMLNAHKPQWSNWQVKDFIDAIKPDVKVVNGQKMFRPSEAFSVLRRLQKVKFWVKHHGKMQDEKTYVIQRFIFDAKYGEQGANSKNVTFEKKMPNGTTKTTSVFDHYSEAYGIKLQYPSLPIIESTRKGYFPMELCNISVLQRYPFKLDPGQTAAMIKFAVTRPAIRQADIMRGCQALDYAHDPYLNAFGIKVSHKMQVTKARVLQNPEIAFANQKHNPGVIGKWDLRGKKFLEPNQISITAWGIVVCGNACTKAEATTWAEQFQQTYKNHGAKIQAKMHVVQKPASSGDYGTICASGYEDIRTHFQRYPQMVFFVVPDKNSLVYERIKKNMDCRFVSPSQVLQGGQVKKAGAQYMSNVSMKVNAKLGGVTCKVASESPFKCPTMMIGVDVSHAAPGSEKPSMAAMTVSMDKTVTRYAAACQTNGWRDDILHPTTVHSMFPPLLKHWVSLHKTAPIHVYYFRDGVDEGNFDNVLKFEMEEIQRAFTDNNFQKPKMTVIIATKRHHIRFFPQHGDKNGNALPGTLVERDATHPHHFDFYLCSHVAIQGTARPVHYQVIHDDFRVDVNELQAMIYSQCYQYARATTPVSLHPAVYYAHVASNRARSHENSASSEKENIGGKAGFPTAKHPSQIQSAQDRSRQEQDEALQEPMQLVPMARPNIPQAQIVFMNTTMWYI